MSESILEEKPAPDVSAFERADRDRADRPASAGRTTGSAAFGSAKSGSASFGSGGEAGLGIDAVMRSPVTVQVVLGNTTMPVADLMRLSQGAIVPLDSRVGEPVDVVVNGRVVARGELVVMDDDNTRFGISLTEVVGSRPPEEPGH
jgi:flagellar motor switch protein FliN/FliY